MAEFIQYHPSSTDNFAMHRHSQTSNIDRNAASVTTIMGHLFPESRETHASQPSFLKLLK